MSTTPRRGAHAVPAVVTAYAVVLAALSIAPAAAAPPTSAFDPHLSGLRLRVRGVVVPYDVFAVFALPGERLTLEVSDAPGGDLAVEADAGEVARAGESRWTWRAPERPGTLTTVRIRRADGSVATHLNAFVLVPATAVKNERVEGYRIGRYPAKPLRGLDIYRPPRGFVRLTADVADVAVSPHFTLGQFRCKQDGGPPEFLVLREALLAKLEYLLRATNEHGIRTDSFHVMSGFRTPFYNHAIGNRTYSRHVWGGAADIFVDVAPRDGRMDDLDGNGTIDKGDAAVLYRLFDGLSDRAEHGDHVGGLGEYGTTSAHGPFVHLDARGFRARWGH